MRLSRPGSKGATGSSATPEGSGFAWSFLSHLSSMVLNRLQMTISNVHICFQVGPPGPGSLSYSHPSALILPEGPLVLSRGTSILQSALQSNACLLCSQVPTVCDASSMAMLLS